MRALVDQAQREAGLVDVVTVVFAQLGEGLDTDGQFSARHWAGLRGSTARKPTAAFIENISSIIDEKRHKTTDGYFYCSTESWQATCSTTPRPRFLAHAVPARSTTPCSAAHPRLGQHCRTPENTGGSGPRLTDARCGSGLDIAVRVQQKQKDRIRSITRAPPQPNPIGKTGVSHITRASGGEIPVILRSP